MQLRYFPADGRRLLRLLRHDEHASLQPESQILVERHAQVAQAQRRLREMPGTHFSLVVGACDDLRRGGAGQLRICRLAEAHRLEARPDSSRTSRAGKACLGSVRTWPLATWRSRFPSASINPQPVQPRPGSRPTINTRRPSSGTDEGSTLSVSRGPETRSHIVAPFVFREADYGEASWRADRQANRSSTSSDIS